MNLPQPYPDELMRIARRVVWFDKPERALEDLRSFLAQLMVYGTKADVECVEHYAQPEDFRQVLAFPPAGVFTQEAWDGWHERLGVAKSPLPRRQFPDGWQGPEAGGFLGR